MRSLVDRHNRLRGDIHNPIDTYLPDQQARFGFCPSSGGPPGAIGDTTITVRQQLGRAAQLHGGRSQPDVGRGI